MSGRMIEVINADERLICRIDVVTGAIEIKLKGCVTLIGRPQNGKIKVIGGQIRKTSNNASKKIT